MSYYTARPIIQQVLLVSENRKNKRRSKSIDLHAEKTEDEIFQLYLGLSEDMPTIWFNWMRWIFTLGIIAYLSDLTNSYVFKGLEVVSYTLLAIHFYFYFLSFDIKQYNTWLSTQTTTLRFTLAYLPALLLSLGCFVLTLQIIENAIEQIKILHD